MYNEKIRTQILEGSLAHSPRHLSGTYRGYRVSIQTDNANITVRISASSENDINNANGYQ